MRIGRVLWLDPRNAVHTAISRDLRGRIQHVQNKKKGLSKVCTGVVAEFGKE